MERKIENLFLIFWSRSCWISFFCCRFTCAFCYYGVVLMTTELFGVPSDQLCGAIDKQDPETCSVQCKSLTTSDYVDLLWTTLSEFPGTWFVFLSWARYWPLITILTCVQLFFSRRYLVDDPDHRKSRQEADHGDRTRCVCFDAVHVIHLLSRVRDAFFDYSIPKSFFSPSYLEVIQISLTFCRFRRTFLTTLLITARGAVSGVFQAAYLYTPEVQDLCLIRACV
jgi:hypothetical protein